MPDALAPHYDFSKDTIPHLKRMHGISLLSCAPLPEPRP